MHYFKSEADPEARYVIDLFSTHIKNGEGLCFSLKGPWIPQGEIKFKVRVALSPSLGHFPA